MCDRNISIEHKILEFVILKHIHISSFLLTVVRSNEYPGIFLQWKS